MLQEPTPVLPDLLVPGLKLVFCGTAAGRVSAARGAYYAHPQNRFWTTLAEAGLTPQTLEPSNYRALRNYGIGLTDLAKYVSGMDAQLPRGSLGHAAADALRARIERYSPRILAFTSLTGGRCFLGPRAVIGAQPERIGDTQLWVLPSPSPAARGSWKPEVWYSLADAVREL